MSLLDTACARVAVSQSAIPARIADLRAEIASYDSEITAREAERELGEADEARLEETRQRVLGACRKAHEKMIVVTHGTDTMAETAAVLGQAMKDGDLALAGKKIVITGAMVPYSVSGSDALFNLGGAVLAAQLTQPGVYILMNRRCFH